MSERSAIEMPTTAEFAAQMSRAADGFVPLIEAVRAFSRVCDAARYSMQEFNLIATTIAAADSRRDKLIRQMVAKARGRNWRTVR